MELKEAVEQGVIVLDNYDPNWFASVDLNYLSMADYNLCVLGQYFGGFSTGADTLARYNGYEGSYAEWSYDHGFDVSDAGYYDELDNLWWGEVKARQNGAKPE